MPGPTSSVAGSVKSESRSNGGYPKPLRDPSVLFLIAIAILLIAHALGLIPRFRSLLEAALRSGQSVATPGLRPVLYGLAGLIACLLLLTLARSIEMLFGGLRNPAPLTTRAAKPFEQFVNEAAAGKISASVAHESYYLLGPHCPDVLCVDLNDSLRDDLGLSDEQIHLLEEKLLTRCDRQVEPAHATDLSALLTVRDLLLRVESAAPPRTEERADRRRPETPARPPGPVLRGPTSGQRKALRAAALQEIESRLLRSPEPSKLLRRSSDYDGPRRRATDEVAGPVYEGPYRRTADRTGTASTERIA